MAQADAQAFDRCRSSDPKVVTHDARVVVYSVRDSDGDRFVCARLRRPGAKPLYLDTAYSKDLEGEGGLTMLRLRGVHVGFVDVVFDYRADGPSATPNVADVVKRTVWEKFGSDGHAFSKVSALAISSTGALAWIATPFDSTTDLVVYRSDRRGVRLLDRSPAIQPDYLRVVSHTVSWRADGTRRTATID